MKTTIRPLNPTALFLLLFLLAAGTLSASDSTIAAGDDRTGIRALPVKSKPVSRNNDLVKIFPGIVKRQIHIKARKKDGKDISLLVFDKEGTLVKQFLLKEKEHVVIDALERGKYTYAIFCEAAEVANGYFEMR